jgi:membrane protease YdiL (CAAX protease family)
MPTSARSKVILFLVLSYALSSIFYWQIASAGQMKMFPVLGLMWCPGAAALITRLITQRNLRGIGWGWGRTRWQVLAYLLPPLMALVVYGIVWLTGVGGFSDEKLTAFVAKEIGRELPFPAILALLATAGFLQGAVFALGEEIGWRGLLVPELATMTSFTKTALISGAAWSVYHYPLIFSSDYTSGAPRWYVLAIFTWVVIAASFGFAWLRLKSGSVWTAVILHASHNLFLQEIFDPLTVDKGTTRYFTTEFGLGMALAYTAAAWYFWRRRGELPRVDRSDPVALS